MIILMALIVFSLGVGFLTNQWKSLAPSKFEVSRIFDQKRVEVGETVPITTVMTNKKILPLPWVMISSYMPDVFSAEWTDKDRLTAERHIEYNIVTSFLFYERVKRHDYFEVGKRGYYKLPPITASFGDLFGFTKAEYTYLQSDALYVYPKVKPLHAFNLIANTMQGQVSVRRWINPDPIQAIGVRQYTHNDSFNTIDWKSTAKTGALQVKKMDFTAEPSVCICLDVQTTDVHWHEIDKEVIERGVELSAAIIQEAMNEKMDVGFCSNSVDALSRTGIIVPPSSNPSQRTMIFDALALLTVYRGLSMENLLRKMRSHLKQDALVVFISAFLTENLVNELNDLAKKGSRIKVILLKSCSLSSKFSPRIECMYALSDENMEVTN